MEGEGVRGLEKKAGGRGLKLWKKLGARLARSELEPHASRCYFYPT